MRERVRVLHVEDEPDFADTVAVFLEEVDDRLDVLTATGAGDGLDRLAGEEIDCIVSDYDMPGEDGIEFLSSVREEHPELPFILYTGKGSEEVASEAISAGVTDYLQKETGTDQYAILANRILNAVERSRAQRQVERSRQELREIIDQLPHVLYVIDEAERYLLANETFAEFQGTTTDEIEGATAADVLDDELYERFRADLRSVLESGEPQRIDEIEVTDSSGTTHVHQPRLVPYTSADTDDRAVLGIAIDITERKEHERERRWMQEALDRSGEAVFVTDPETASIEYVNDTACEQLGYDREELLEMAILDIRPGLPTMEAWHEHVDWLRSEGHTYLEGEHVTRDGSRIPIEVNTGVVDVDGREYLLGLARDVTHREERGYDLAGSDRLLEAVFEASPAAILAYDRDGIVQLWNPGAERIFGWSADEVVGEPLPTVPAGKDHEKEDIHERVFSGEALTEVELRRETKSGEVIDISLSTAPIRDPDGTVVGNVSVTQDVGERKERGRELETMRSRMELALSGTGSVIWERDLRTDSFTGHGPVEEVYGRSGGDDSGIGETIDDFYEMVNPDDRDRVREAMETAVATGQEYRTEYRATSDGELRWFRTQAAVFDDDDGEPRRLVGLDTDVTDLKRRERAIEELHSTARAIMQADTATDVAEIAVEAMRDTLDLSINAVWFYDEDEHLLRPVAWTDYAREVVGQHPTFGPGGSLSWEVFETGETRTYDDVSAVTGRYNTETTIRSQILLPLGEYGVINIGSTAPQVFDETDVSLAETVAAHMETALAHIADKAELERQNERLEEFASVVSHDLRTPLATARGSLELARERGDPHNFERINQSLERIERIIDDVLWLAREGKEIGTKERVDLREAVEAAWDIVAGGTAGAALEHRGVEDYRVDADPDRLSQVLENLLGNAVQHGGPDVTVRVEATEDGFAVADDGPGIPESDRELVFERGYSTATEGTGLGLSIVRQIAEAHGWEVEARESAGGGVRIEVAGVESAS